MKRWMLLHCFWRPVVGVASRGGSSPGEGGTSASTLSAYESGTSVPSVSTLVRLLRAAGFEAEASLRPAPLNDEQDLAEKIEALFAFVDVLPREKRGPLRYPVFPAPKTAAR